MKNISRQEIIGSLARKLGHDPTPDEVTKELNGVGLVILASEICGETVKAVSFAEQVDGEYEDITPPNINGHVRCKECLSYDNWKFVDADWDPDTNQQWFTYGCKGSVRFSQYSEFPCEERVTIYLDENKKPIYPKK